MKLAWIFLIVCLLWIFTIVANCESQYERTEEELREIDRHTQYRWKRGLNVDKSLEEVRVEREIQEQGITYEEWLEQQPDYDSNLDDPDDDDDEDE